MFDDNVVNWPSPKTIVSWNENKPDDAQWAWNCQVARSSAGGQLLWLVGILALIAGFKYKTPELNFTYSRL